MKIYFSVNGDGITCPVCDSNKLIWNSDVTTIPCYGVLGNLAGGYLGLRCVNCDHTFKSDGKGLDITGLPGHWLEKIKGLKF